LTFFLSLPYGPGMRTVALPVLCTLLGPVGLEFVIFS
jgi:hypothetical protein